MKTKTEHHVSTRERRRAVRGHVWRRSRLGLSLVGLASAMGVVLYGLEVPFAFTDEVFGHRPMDESLENWLLVIAVGLILVLGGTGRKARPLLRRLPMDPVDELRGRLEIGLACGVCVLAAFLFVELFARPVMMKPSFGNRLNPAEAATLESLGGVPLLRFIVDGQSRRTLVTGASLENLHRDGLSGLSRYVKSVFVKPEPPPGLAPGDVLVRVTRQDWSSLSSHRWNDLRDLGLPERVEVEVIYEGLVPKTDYLAGNWRRDGLFRDRAWPSLDRAAGFLALVVMGISALCSRSTLSWQVWSPFFVLVIWISPHIWLRYAEEKGRLLFSNLGPDFTLRAPLYPGKILWGQQLVFPTLMAALGLAFFLAGRLDIRRTYRGRIGLAILAPLSAAALALMYDLTTAPRAAPTPQRQGQSLSEVKSSLLDLAAVADLTEFLLTLSWIAALGGAFVVIVTRAQTWTRRNALLRRLPVPPQVVARQRWKRTVFDLTLFSGLPWILEELAVLIWTATGGLDDRFTRGDISSEIGGFGALALALAGVLAIVLIDAESWMAKAVATIALIALAYVASSHLSLGRPVPWWILAAPLAVTLPLLYRVMERRVSPRSMARSG